jgi:O-methyltransferase
MSSKSDIDKQTAELHKKLDMKLYLDAFYSNISIGPLNFYDLFHYCIKTTQTPIPAFKAFRRIDRLHILLKYFIFAQNNSHGSIAECGVYKGMSALAMTILMTEMSHIQKKEKSEIWLIDSYEGLSELAPEDFIEEDKFKKGHFAVPLEFVKKHFNNIDFVKFAKGWIPDVFKNLPDQEYSFVHIDVDLHDPIRDSLEYFYPRLAKSGVIINDDYNSANFPGAKIAWDNFFKKQNKAFAIMDSGQAIFINN